MTESQSYNSSLYRRHSSYWRKHGKQKGEPGGQWPSSWCSSGPARWFCVPGVAKFIAFGPVKSFTFIYFILKYMKERNAGSTHCSIWHDRGLTRAKFVLHLWIFNSLFFKSLSFLPHQEVLELALLSPAPIAPRWGLILPGTNSVTESDLLYICKGAPGWHPQCHHLTHFTA